MVWICGFAFADYWCGCAGAAIFGLAHYCWGRELAMWAFLYSEDGCLVDRKVQFEYSFVVFMLVLSLINGLMSWHKMSGRNWNGMSRLPPGRWVPRCAIRWLEDKAREQRVKLGNYEKVWADCNSLRDHWSTYAHSSAQFPIGLAEASALRSPSCPP